jgi:hypothetical protein
MLVVADIIMECGSRVMLELLQAKVTLNWITYTFILWITYMQSWYTSAWFYGFQGTLITRFYRSLPSCSPASSIEIVGASLTRPQGLALKTVFLPHLSVAVLCNLNFPSNILLSPPLALPNQKLSLSFSSSSAPDWGACLRANIC